MVAIICARYTPPRENNRGNIKNGTLQQEAILVTLDVTPLYNNILIPEGLASVELTLSRQSAQHCIEVYLTLLE